MTNTQGTGTATPQEPTSNTAPTEDSPVAATTDVPTVETDNKRTQGQFDKLLDSNKRLFEANDNLRKQLTTRALADEQFAPIKQQPIPQQSIQEVSVADFVEIDPQSGEKFIDDKKLQARIQELNEKASNAEQAVQKYIQASEDREIDRQNEVAFKAYPELNPTSETHNKKFHNQTRALIYDSLINPQDYGGKPLSFKAAADFVKGGDDMSVNEKNQQASASINKPEGQTVAANTPTGEDAKQQAAASIAGGQPDTRDALAGSEELKELQQATRLGNNEALARRIANSDHILVKEDDAGETTS